MVRYVMFKNQKFYDMLFTDVHIYHEAMMPHQKHACIENSCSHICLLSSNFTYTCACPENMELLTDKHTCQLSQKSYQIIMGIGKNLVSIPYQTFGRHVNTFADDLGLDIDQLEFNSVSGEVFVANDQTKKILKVDMENRNVFELVNDHVFSVQSLAYGKLDCFEKSIFQFLTREIIVIFQTIWPTICIGSITRREQLNCTR